MWLVALNDSMAPRYGAVGRQQAFRPQNVPGLLSKLMMNVPGTVRARFMLITYRGIPRYSSDVSLDGGPVVL